MSLQLHYEKNSMRKSHRMKIPLKVYIENQMYNAFDWSLTGLGIQSIHDESFKDKNLYDAVVLLNLREATISIKVKLRLIYQKNDKFGFEFAQLSKKNTKLLRRYLELCLYGKLDQIDNLMAVYEEPEITTAIQDPIKLNDGEKRGLEKSFLRKSINSIVLSLLLFSAAVAVLYYNLQYQYESVGTVEGNYKNIYPKNEGVIEKIYVKSGDIVHQNDILVDLNSDKVLHQLKVLETIKDTKTKEKQAQAVFQRSMIVVDDDNEVLNLKKQMLQESYQNFKNAKIQFENHLITKTDIQNIKKSYLSAKERYELYKKQRANQKNINIPPVQKIINVKATELKIINKNKLLETFRIFSPQNATVYEVNVEIGDNVSKKELLLTLWTHHVPQIICTIEADKAINVKIGSKVEIVGSQDGQKFTGIVKKISNMAHDKDLNKIQQNSMNEVFIVIDPEEKTKVLPPRSVVKVLFKRTFWFDI